MSDVTKILDAVKRGDRDAAKELLPLTYNELRRIAGSMMAKERVGHTLQPTALIHEAYVRLAGDDGEQPDWDTRAHFFTAAAEAMRWILIDHARGRQSMKRGGDYVRTTWDEAKFETEAPAEELVAVDEALAKFEKENPEAANVVKLRYFAGMTVDETAAALGVSPSTVNRIWKGARAWLFREISEDLG